MKSQLVTVLAVILLVPTGGALAQNNLPPEVLAYPDWVLHNGAILTMDSDSPPIRSAEAIAVRGNRILAVGDNSRILAMVGPQTQKIDLQGKAVIPGVIDTHSHPNRYALSGYQDDIPLEIRQQFYPLKVDYDVETKEELLANIANAVKDVPASVPWVATQEPSQGSFTNAWRSLTRHDMDTIIKDRPLSSIWRWLGPVNTRAIEVLTEKFGPNLPGIIRDEDGDPTGWVEGVAAWVIYTDMRPSLAPQYLAPIYKKELEEWVAIGVTTLSTRLSGHEISGYARLARNNELPLRLAVSHDGVGRWNPLFEWYLGRLGNIQGFGYKDRMWIIGLSVGIPDAGPEGGLVASRAPKINPLPTDNTGKDSVFFWEAEGDPTPEHIQIANRYGYRITGVHSFGDRAYEGMLEAYRATLGEMNDTGEYPPYTLDHLMMVSPAVLEGIRDLTANGSRKNLVLSVQTPMMFGRRSATVRRIYGEQVFWQWLQPVRSLMEAGAILSYGADTGSDPERQPMHSLEVIVTRENHEGIAVNPPQALSREQGLLMLTRGGKYYVGRDDLGSLEAGNLADLVILGQNPLDPRIPDRDLSEIQVLMTMIDGEAAYLSPDFEF